MEELYSIDEVNFGSVLHTFATEFFWCEEQEGDVSYNGFY
jgi:hypothetical protein